MRKKFTLIELLVVIAMIGLLLSILMPSLSKAREKARGAVCLNNMRQSYTAILLYADDNDEYGPKTNNDRNGQRWYNKLIPEYLPEYNLSNGTSSSLLCPSGVNVTAKWQSTIAINPNVSDNGSFEGVKIVHWTSKSMVLMDSYKNWHTIFPLYMVSANIQEDTERNNIARHLGSANICKADGSAKSHKGNTLFYLTDATDIFWDFD